MIHGIHRSHVCQQSLCCTNIGSRFFAANMLLTRLQCHAQRTVALRIHTCSNYPPRNISFEFIFCCKKSGVRPAEPHGNTKSL